MNSFFAILRDSFREAVDGFVIYVMLALSLIVIIIAASLSFKAAPADDAFPSIVSRFGKVYRNRGADREEVAIKVGTGFVSQQLSLPVEYTVADVQKLDAGTGATGTYKFRITAKNGESKPTRGPGPGIAPKSKDNTDWFRYTVAAWSQPKLREQTVRVNPDTGEIDLVANATGAANGPSVTLPIVTESEWKAVTDEAMADFFKNQFLLQAGIEDVTVKRVFDGNKEPVYAFDVEAKGGANSSGWKYTTKIFFGAFPISQGNLGDGILLIEDTIVNGIGALITLLIAIVLTAFYIPNLLRKGSLDLIIAKPVSRWQLLIYKYIGGLSFMFLVSSFTIVGVWIAIGIKSGYWNPAFLTSIFMLTFTFAILYAVSTFMGVLTRNAIVAILVTIAFMFLLWLVGTGKTLLDAYRSAEKADPPPKWVEYTVDGLNAVLPRYKDLDKLNSKMLAESLRTPAETKALTIIDYPSWGAAISVSLGFIAVMLGLSYWRFATRDG